MPLTSETLKTFLADDLGVEDAIEDSTPLFSSSIIDSFQMMTLIGYIEKVCDFKVESDDVTLENLDTVERILAYTSQRA